MQHIITIIVLYAVAKFDLTSLIPIFAKIVVSDVATALISANNNQFILSSFYQKKNPIEMMRLQT